MAPVKLWLDDVRKPPDDGWYWALDVDDAAQFLKENQVTEQSLDHDLGPGCPDGLTLLVWEHDHHLVPYHTTIHTWNEVGAARMSTFLKQHRHSVEVQQDPRPPVKETE